MTAGVANDFDIIVVGGGPVGLVGGLVAAMSGLRACVIESRGEPVDKACGEGLMPHALALLDGLGVDPPGERFDGISYLSASGGDRAVARFTGAPGRGVRRVVLHEELVRRAKELDVASQTGRVVGIQQSLQHVEVRLSDGQRLSARYVLGADGLLSTVRRQFAVSPTAAKHPRYGLRQHFEVARWSDFVEVHWGERAEAYVTPVSGNTVGVALLGPRAMGDFAQRLSDFPALSNRLRQARATGNVLGAGPLRQKVARRVYGRVLLVGDAAGYVDALTGEGLSVGFESARAAVESILLENAQSYEQEWKSITRRYRWMTLSLLAATRQPLIRRTLVPLSARLPNVFSSAVNALAK
ncbi:MAG TPA: NAD(P)/FAD-dependent oxidoreductase [Actinomycetes bacterium]|nr:NAD(P)/FAD-dependent oxidoreductase [Actinomycetes bacterium]